MSERIDLDLVIDASEEAKICLNCTKKECRPMNCTRYKQLKKQNRKEQKNETR